MSIGASRHIPAGPYWTWDGCSRLYRPRHLSPRGPSHHRICIWSDGCVGHPAARQNFRSPHQPSSNARAHCRWKDDSRDVSPIRLVPSSRRTTRGVHGETNLQPIRVPSRPRHYETGQRCERSGLERCWRLQGLSC